MDDTPHHQVPSRQSIIQWNCQGIRNKKDELLNIIATHRPSIVALQETKLRDTSTFRIPAFNIMRKDGHQNHSTHGGVALLTHSSIPCTRISLTTPLQAIAIKVHLHVLMTVCCIYTSPSHTLTHALLQQLLAQLPAPVVIVGDFNGHNTAWGCSTTNPRGTIMEEFALHNNLNILNNGAPTRISYNTESAIDLSLASPRLTPDIEWSVFSSPADSDHCPIKLTFMHDDHVPNNHAPPNRNWKRADWGTYTTSTAWNDILNVDTTPCDELLQDLHARIRTAADESIPQYQITKFYPKPWWSNELKISRHTRERAYHSYRNTKSPRNLIAWKKARAEFRQLVIKSKADSWKKFISSLTHNAPSSSIYEKIRQIKGKPQRQIHILHDNNQTYSTIPAIADRLSQAFSDVSDPSNLPRAFQAVRRAGERNEINFSSANDEQYNVLFTLPELEQAISDKNTTPGPDGIHYLLIRHLPDTMKNYLLLILNKFWTTNHFPEGWSESTIIPIPKPSKDHSLAINYRPIALTSCLCKTMERLINTRLLDYLEIYNIMSPIQCGCLRGRSTVDHLVRLETEIRKAQAHSQHCVSVFFDLEKAYDTTWRYGILRDLFQAGLRGRLPHFINNFLHNRYFRVKIDHHHSVRREQKAGVPQGSVLSVILFALKINAISKQIPTTDGFLSSLYVDDLQISFRHRDLNVIQTTLQSTLNTINTWATENGFKFSSTKTKMVHFHILRGIIHPPVLRLNNTPIPCVETFKFLGLTWDSKLTWRPHINILKGSCQKALNILRSVSSLQWGADQPTLIKLYRTLIRSKLDYGCTVYNSANQANLNLLEPIANEALRIATGAFKSTPIQSLQILANEMPLQLRRDNLTLKYYYKIRSHLGNPAFNHAIPTYCSRLFQNKPIPHPFPLRASKLIADMNLEKRYIQPAFSYTLLGITTPTWAVKRASFNFELTEHPKTITSAIAYRQLFSRMLTEQYHNSIRIYTDGSKHTHGVGSAAVSGTTIRKATLPQHATILTAELYAIQLALTFIKAHNSLIFTIFSDSLSSLSCIASRTTTHPLARRLQHVIDDIINSGKSLTLCWIPSHVGIKGNERVDVKAVEAASGTPEFITIPYTDLLPLLYPKFVQRWTDTWTASNEKLYQIKPSPGPWNTRPGITRKQEVIINRLRAGHTRITHSHLMDGTVLTLCELCNVVTLTVKHIFLDCPALAPLRATCFPVPRGETLSLRTILADDTLQPNQLFQFITDAGLIDNI